MGYPTYVTPALANVINMFRHRIISARTIKARKLKNKVKANEAFHHFSAYRKNFMGQPAQSDLEDDLN